MEPSAVYFLFHFLSGRPAWPLTSTLPYGVPTFLDLHLLGADPHSMQTATTQPAHRRLYRPTGAPHRDDPLVLLTDATGVQR